MGDFVRLSHKLHCGCLFSEEGVILSPCAGHRDREMLQRAKRAPVVPIKQRQPHLLARLWRMVR